MNAPFYYIKQMETQYF